MMRTIRIYCIVCLFLLFVSEVSCQFKTFESLTDLKNKFIQKSEKGNENVILLYDISIESSLKKTKVVFHYVKLINQSSDFLMFRVDSGHDKKMIDYNGRLLRDIGGVLRTIKKVTTYDFSIFSEATYDSTKKYCVTIDAKSLKGDIFEWYEAYEYELPQMGIKIPLFDEDYIDRVFISVSTESKIHTQYLFLNTGSIEPTNSIASQGSHTYIWDFYGSSMLQNKNSFPMLLIQVPSQVSGNYLTSWKDFGSWYYSKIKKKLSLSKKHHKTVDSLIKGCQNDQDKIDKIYNYVISNMRYVQIYKPLENILPKSADEIMENKFGDCKDFAVLMVALLRYANFDAHYAIALVDKKVKNSDKIVVTVFDHVVVYIATQNKEYWIDATSDYGSSGTPPYHITGNFALIIDEKESKMVFLPENEENNIEYSFAISSIFNGNCNGTLTVKVSGQFTDMFRVYKSHFNNDRYESEIEKGLKTVIKDNVVFNDIQYIFTDKAFTLKAGFLLTNSVISVGKNHFMSINKLIKDILSKEILIHRDAMSTKTPITFIYPKGRIQLLFDTVQLGIEKIDILKKNEDIINNGWIRSDLSTSIIFETDYNFSDPTLSSEDIEERLKLLSYDLSITQK